MEDVVKEAKEIAEDDHIKLFFTEEEVRRLDGEIRYEAGFKDGHEQGIHEMIFNMYNKKVPIETIAECANLSTSEIQNIINNQ